MVTTTAAATATTWTSDRATCGGRGLASVANEEAPLWGASLFLNGTKTENDALVAQP